MPPPSAYAQESTAICEDAPRTTSPMVMVAPLSFSACQESMVVETRSALTMALIVPT